MRSILRLTIGLALLIPAAASAEGKGDAAKGAETYKLYCATCHGPTGLGDGPVGKTLNPPPRNFQAGDFKYGGSDQDIFDIITEGAAAKGGSPLMAPWGGVITKEEDRWNLVAFIRSLQKK